MSTEKENSSDKNVVYVNRNTVKIVKDGYEVLKKNWSEVVSCTILYIFTIVAICLFPVFGFVLSFFCTGFLSVGYIGFILSVINGKKVKLESIFSYIKHSLSAFALRLTMCAYVFLWSLLLIVPGIIASLNYSFAMSIMSDSPSVGAFSALEKSKELTKGYRDVIFSIYMLLLLSTMIIYGIIFALLYLFVAYASMKLWIALVIAGVICGLIFASILMPYFQVCISSIYIEAKANKRFKESKKTATKNN